MSIRNDDQEIRAPVFWQRTNHPPTTDQEIQKWISRQRGFVPETAWIAHCKDLFGLAASGTALKKNPCPPEKIAAIKQAFRRFGLLKIRRVNPVISRVNCAGRNLTPVCCF